MNKIDCQRCEHYYVTWDENFPHGCRVMKFKSRLIPAWEVAKHSGQECLLFQKRKMDRKPNRKS